jgi:hypothetical protein
MVNSYKKAVFFFIFNLDFASVWQKMSIYFIFRAKTIVKNNVICCYKLKIGPRESGDKSCFSLSEIKSIFLSSKFSFFHLFLKVFYFKISAFKNHSFNEILLNQVFKAKCPRLKFKISAGYQQTEKVCQYHTSIKSA